MDIEYTSEQREAYILDSLITTRALLNTLLQERAEDLAERHQTRWPDELKKLEEKVENERQIVTSHLQGKGLENNLYTEFTFKPKF